MDQKGRDGKKSRLKALCPRCGTRLKRYADLIGCNLCGYGGVVANSAPIKPVHLEQKHWWDAVKGWFRG